jgi:hypothetical protein
MVSGCCNPRDGAPGGEGTNNTPASTHAHVAQCERAGASSRKRTREETNSPTPTAAMPAVLPPRSSRLGRKGTAAAAAAAAQACLPAPQLSPQKLAAAPGQAPRHPHAASASGLHEHGGVEKSRRPALEAPRCSDGLGSSAAAMPLASAKVPPVQRPPPAEPRHLRVT